VKRLRHMLRHCWGDRRGNVAIVTGLALPVLVGFTGLGVESGYWYYEQRRLQASADLAAYAGAIAARGGAGHAAIVGAAQTEAGLHGFDPASGAIEINWPPVSGGNVNARSVEVLLEQAYPRSFSSVFIDDRVVMTVRAVASFEEPGPACVIALHEMQSQSLLFSGNANARFTGCNLMSNSLAEDAVTIQGAVEVTASCVNSSGGIYNNATLVLDGCPEPRLNMPRAADPFAGLGLPQDAGPCLSVPGGPGAKTLSAGRYCGGFDLRGDVDLEPGVYVVSGGAMRINANARVVGTGVTFILTQGATVHMNGAAGIDLTAQSSGPYQGVLFYGDRNSPGSHATFNGTASSSLRGALYFPEQHLAMLGDFDGSGGCTRIVALTIEVRGNPDFRSDCTGIAMGPIATPGAVRLVE
jgi:hypothetical protein